MSNYDTAYALLQSMGPAEAARLLNSEVDFRNFLDSHRIQLDDREIEELKAQFRA